MIANVKQWGSFSTRIQFFIWTRSFAPFLLFVSFRAFRFFFVPFRVFRDPNSRPGAKIFKGGFAHEIALPGLPVPVLPADRLRGKSYDSPLADCRAGDIYPTSPTHLDRHADSLSYPASNPYAAPDPYPAAHLDASHPHALPDPEAWPYVYICASNPEADSHNSYPNFPIDARHTGCRAGRIPAKALDRTGRLGGDLGGAIDR
jgi:hypothetical protein